MGKVKGEKPSRKGLTEELMESANPIVNKSKRSKIKNSNRMDDDEGFVSNKLSKKILDQARKQQDELEEEYGLHSSGNKSKKEYLSNKKQKNTEEEFSSEEEEDFESRNDDYYEDVQIDSEDEKAMEEFMSSNPKERRTLADIIMEKINEKKTEIQSQISEKPDIPPLDEKVVTVFKSVGEILSKYRAGKLPKAFKILPSLQNWEEILYITNPDEWTPAAMYQATKIFVSNLNAKMAQRFFNLVLLPRVRDDISEYKRLNYHLYMALKKALFKPAAFFKGILLPLCESGTCTLREATIIGSVLAKTSIPFLHSATVLLKISEMDYTGANSIFIRILIDKKYALPFRVIDSLVYHFLRFQSDNRTLPVLWHQSFLSFIQRYKEDIASEQKEALIELCRKHNHHKITPEIRREITHSKSRDLEVPSEAISVPMKFDDE